MPEKGAWKYLWPLNSSCFLWLFLYNWKFRCNPCRWLCVISHSASSVSSVLFVKCPGWWCCFMQFLCLTFSVQTSESITRTVLQTGFVIPLLLWSSRCPSGPHGFQERLAASQEAMKNKNVVNLGAIRQGMKRFQFLLNCCEPGTIPDASILAAALDLVRFTLEKIMKQE